MQRRKRKELAQSSDIAFLLIIFFLLLAGLDVTKALSYRQAEPAQAPAPSTPLVLSLEGDGTLRYQSQEISLSQCEELFREIEQVDLEVDDHATWQEVVDVLAIAEQSQAKVVIHEAP